MKEGLDSQTKPSNILIPHKFCTKRIFLFSFFVQIIQLQNRVTLEIMHVALDFVFKVKK